MGERAHDKPDRLRNRDGVQLANRSCASVVVYDCISMSRNVSRLRANSNTHFSQKNDFRKRSAVLVGVKTLPTIIEAQKLKL
jgi:hypothetical protein